MAILLRRSRSGVGASQKAIDAALRSTANVGPDTIDGKSVVESGLSPGEQVITGGQYKVQPGTLVGTAVASSDPVQPKVRQE